MTTDTAPFRPIATGSQPPNDTPEYGSTRLRHPRQPPLRIPHSVTETTGPLFAESRFPAIADLSMVTGKPALGERIIVRGRVIDEAERPIPNTMIEIWQANASGRYAHQRDQHPAPLDPHFSGVGRCLTDEQGRYRFTTIKPGAYPWRNHDNAWRPAHIHFSLFGSAFTQRLITQMYFPGDPLFVYDPILQSVTDSAARDRLVAAYEHDLSVPEWSLGYRWDIVLDGPAATWIEEGR
jgi:protocatechuate 3,4-dioxygenase, beta subunit